MISLSYTFPNLPGHKGLSVKAYEIYMMLVTPTLSNHVSNISMVKEWITLFNLTDKIHRRKLDDLTPEIYFIFW